MREAPASGPSPIPRMLLAVEGESVGAVSEAQGPQRDTEAPARQPGLWQGTGSQAGPAGLHSWPDPSAKIPTSPYRVQSAGNPAAGTAVRTHFAKVLKTAGGARSQGRGSLCRQLSDQSAEHRPGPGGGRRREMKRSKVPWVRTRELERIRRQLGKGGEEGREQQRSAERNVLMGRQPERRPAPPPLPKAV